jgi:hypothetical protein
MLNRHFLYVFILPVKLIITDFLNSLFKFEQINLQLNIELNGEVI